MKIFFDASAFLKVLKKKTMAKSSNGSQCNIRMQHRKVDCNYCHLE